MTQVRTNDESVCDCVYLYPTLLLLMRNNSRSHSSNMHTDRVSYNNGQSEMALLREATQPRGVSHSLVLERGLHEAIEKLCRLEKKNACDSYLPQAISVLGCLVT